MALPKPRKKRGSLKNKADFLASAYYRALRPYCEARGKDHHQCGWSLQWCHVYSRAILHLRYEPYNCLTLCSSAHLFYTYHPIEWTRFLEANYPERLAEAEANRYKFWKIDYEEWIEHFTKSPNLQ